MSNYTRAAALLISAATGAAALGIGIGTATTAGADPRCQGELDNPTCTCPYAGSVKYYDPTQGEFRCSVFGVDGVPFPPPAPMPRPIPGVWPPPPPPAPYPKPIPGTFPPPTPPHDNFGDVGGSCGGGC